MARRGYVAVSGLFDALPYCACCVFQRITFRLCFGIVYTPCENSVIACLRVFIFSVCLANGLAILAAKIGIVPGMVAQDGVSAIHGSVVVGARVIRAEKLAVHPVSSHCPLSQLTSWQPLSGV